MNCGGIVEFRADLPATGVRASDQFGPNAPDDKGDVVKIQVGEDEWYIRLEAGVGGQLACYELSGGQVLVLNNKGNVYWIATNHRRVQFVPSRYNMFATKAASEGSVVAYDFNDVCLIDQNGLRWKQEEVAGDGLEITGFTQEGLILTGWRGWPDNRIRLELSFEDGSERILNPES